MARGRGGSTPLSEETGSSEATQEGESEREASEDGDGDDEQMVFRSDEGSLKTNTGYMVRFIPSEKIEHFRGTEEAFSVFDALTVEHWKSYPLSSSALESLPAHIVTMLEEQGYARVHGHYDSGSGKWEAADLGWSPDVEDPVDRLMALVEETDREVPALDYFVSVFGPERWQDAERIAEARGVEDETVQEHIRSVRKVIDRDDAPEE